MNLSNEINKIIENLNKKEFKKVINESEKLISKNVKNTQIYNLCGIAYQNLGLHDKSIYYFEKSIDIEKNNYFALNNLAYSLKAIQKIELSDNAYENCLKIKPNYLTAILNYASLKEEKNEIEKSIELYLYALELNSDSEERYILSKLSRLYLSIGNSQKAKNYALKILEKNPKDASAYSLLSDLTDLIDEKKMITDMKNLYLDENLNDEDIINLSFSLGKVYDKLKKFNEAFLYFSKGNELKRKYINYNYKDIEILTKSIKKIFQNLEIYKVKKKISDKKIIFICGMPRSGTTLIEQIISSHRDVVATGEYNSLSFFIKNNYLNKFKLDGKKLYKDIFSKENKIQKHYLDILNQNKFFSNIFTDKSIQNFLWIGFIKIFFPNSKIILTERNSRDVSLSIFKINFKNGFMNFAYSQDEIAEFYNNYFDLTNFWKNLFNDEIYTVSYEKLIKNPDEEIKDIINFCELKWDSNCLNHHKNKSSIHTASIDQARKPIYQTSENKSNYYSNHLNKMYSLLKN